jgi:hypothetical protein
MLESIKPINITGAAIFAQFSIIMIMFVGSLILYRGQGFVPSFERPKFSGLPWLILGFGLLSIGFLIFSDEFSLVWRPLFGTIDFPTMPWTTALFVMFTTDILCTTFLVLLTGGSRNSAFSPLFFLLPALAIFLREPLSHILFYLISISVVFSLSLKPRADQEEHNFAYWFISIACFILATFIGYVTRPK